MNEPEDAQTSQQTRWIVASVYSLILHTLILVIMALILLSSFHEPELLISSKFADGDENDLLDSRLDLNELGVEVSQVNLLDLNVVPTPDIVNAEYQQQRTVERISQGVDQVLEGNRQNNSGSAFSEFKSRLNRENAQTGAVQVSLIWGDVNDIDLHVVPPSKERIFYSHKRSRCRGYLDVDMNVRPPFSKEPVENIFWPKNNAPRGDYQIFVDYYSRNGGPKTTKVQVMLTINGEAFIIEDEVKKDTPPKLVFSFDYPLSAKSRLKLSGETKRHRQREELALTELKKLEAFLKDKPEVAPARYQRFAERFPGTLAAEKATALAEGRSLESQ